MIEDIDLIVIYKFYKIMKTPKMPQIDFGGIFEKFIICDFRINHISHCLGSHAGVILHLFGIC